MAVPRAVALVLALGLTSDAPVFPRSPFPRLGAAVLVGAPRFELGTPSPPDWCANRAALRSARAGTSTLAPQPAQGRAGRPRNGRLQAGKFAQEIGIHQPRRPRYAASGRDIQRTSGIAGSTQARPATT